VGIGLSICKKIVEFFNGEIYLDSSYTNGTKFKFKIKADNNEHPIQTDRDQEI